MVEADEPEPTFAQADLVPVGVMWVCPACSFAGETDLVEDDYGDCRVPLEGRFIRCENCEALIDIGWQGFATQHGKSAA